MVSRTKPALWRAHFLSLYLDGFSGSGTRRTGHPGGREPAFRPVRTTCKDAPEGDAEIAEAEISITGGSIFLRLKVGDGAVCDFSFRPDGRDFSVIGKPFTAWEGNWIGAKLGLFSLSEESGADAGHADFDWFRFES